MIAAEVPVALTSRTPKRVTVTLIPAPSLLPEWRHYQKKGLWAVQLLLLMAPLAWALYLAAQTSSLNPDDETRAPAAHPAEFAQSRK